MKRRGTVPRHARIEKAQSMKIVIPMKDGRQPTDMTQQFRTHVYDEFASRYLQAIHVEPTKANIARMKAFVPSEKITLVPKFKAHGCIRDELSIDCCDEIDKLPGFTNISGDADLFRKVVNSTSCSMESIICPSPSQSPLLPPEEKLPSLTSEAQNRSDIKDPWYPTKQQVQRALADFSAVNPLSSIQRNIKPDQLQDIETMLQSEQMVDLLQTLCHFLHHQVFLMPSLRDPQALSATAEMHLTPPLTPRTYEATIWRMNEAFALLVAPYKRAKPLLSVVSVMIGFTAREVSKRLIMSEFPQWCRTLDGQAFLPTIDGLTMEQLDPQNYMRGIDLFGDGRTCTEKREIVGLEERAKVAPKRRWMHQMYKLSPLMSTLAGSLMTRKAKKAIAPRAKGEKTAAGTLDDYSRTKRVESMAMGMRKSLPYTNRAL